MKSGQPQIFAPKNGELRRILIENIPDPEMESMRTLKYYSIGADGNQTQLPLAKEQMEIPRKPWSQALNLMEILLAVL